MKLSEITEESTEAQVAQALTDNIVEKFKNVCPSPAIDTMTDDKVKSELDLRGINFLTSYHKMQTELLDRVQDRLKQRDEESKRLHADIERLKSIIEQYESPNNPPEWHAGKTAILGLRERDE